MLERLPRRQKTFVEERRVGKVVLEKMNVRVEREARLVVAEAPLDLHGVPAATKEHCRACVTESVEANPAFRHTLASEHHPFAEPSFDRCRLQHAAHQVRLVYAAA